MGGIPRAQARPAGDGVRHAVRAGGLPQHPDPRLDPVSPLAAARLSRRERDQLADHQGREGNRPLDLLARQRARYRRHPGPEEDADLRHRHARHGLFRSPVPDGRRRDAGRRRPREGRQGAAHQAGRSEGDLRRPLRPRQCQDRLGQAVGADRPADPRLQSGARRLDDARRQDHEDLRRQADARERPEGHRRQARRDRRGRCRQHHGRLRRRALQGHARAGRWAEGGRGRMGQERQHRGRRKFS